MERTIISCIEVLQLSAPVSGQLTRATLAIPVQRLNKAVLDREMLPQDFSAFEVFREGALDNSSMAKQGFPGTTTESLKRHGRVTGYIKEFMSPEPPTAFTAGVNIAVATVAHIFVSEQAVLTWLNEVFAQQFEEHVGKPIAADQQLLAVTKLDVSGFFDRAVALKTLQTGPLGLFSSTIIDFRLGRILGVTYVVAFGDVDRLPAAHKIGLTLERQVVRVVLGSI